MIKHIYENCFHDGIYFNIILQCAVKAVIVIITTIIY